MKKLALILGMMGVSHGVMAAEAAELYEKYCSVCHRAGVAGAPISGDADAWAPRMEKGMDAMVQSVVNGLNAMPAKGLCAECTEEDFVAIIQLMTE